MNKTTTFLSLTFLLFLMASGSTAFSYTDGGKAPDKVLCDDTSSSVLNIDLCADTFTLNGVIYTQDGNYTQTYTNAAGCDSFVHLFLTLKANKPILAVASLVLATAESYKTYQWYKNDTAIAGATDSTYKIESLEPACYSVVVNAAFCPDTSDYYCIRDDSDVKVVEKSLQNQVKIYPNPTSGALILSAPIPVRTQIFSLDGRKWPINHDIKILSLENLPPGIYFIRITDVKGNLVKVERVVKKNSHE